jgi:hypothetical protein
MRITSSRTAWLQSKTLRKKKKKKRKTGREEKEREMHQMIKFKIMKKQKNQMHLQSQLLRRLRQNCLSLGV